MEATRQTLLGTIWAGLSASVLFGQQAVATRSASELLATWDLEKVLDADVLAERLEGGGRSTVIVSLESPRDEIGRSTLRVEGELEAYRGEVHTRVDSVLADLPDLDADLKLRLENSPVFAVEVDATQLPRLLAHPQVLVVEPEVMFETFDFEGPLISGLNLFGRPQGTPNTFGDITGSGVAIAVIDGGFDYTHPWLGGGGFPNQKTIGGWDFYDNDADPFSTNSHGSSVAGLAAGPFDTASNPLPGAWYTGVAPDAKIYALKVSPNGSGQVDPLATLSAMDWCATHQYDDPANPIRVVNMSLGRSCDTYSTPQQSSRNTAAQTLKGLGIIVIAAAGNDGDPNGVSSLAAGPDIVAVGAVWDLTLGVNGNFTACGTAFAEMPSATVPISYSNGGDLLDVWAPADLAHAPKVGGGFVDDFGGTSAAAPYVSGIAALLFQYGQKVGIDPTVDQVRAALRTSHREIVDPRSSVRKPLADWEAAMMFGMPKGVVEVRGNAPDLPQNGPHTSSGIWIHGHEHGTPTYPYRDVIHAVSGASNLTTIRVNVPSTPWTNPWILPPHPGKAVTWVAVGADLVLSYPATYTGG